MKCTIPEIAWHNRDPVLALDIQCNSGQGFYRLATAGTDTHVVIWQLRILENGGVSVEALSDLTRHNRAVNAVRFSPDGKILASADDEAAMILWKRQEDNEANEVFADDTEKANKEHWVTLRLLRGHLEDIYDLCWSSCSQFLISGSVDNTAILWDVAKGKNLGLLTDHKGFVQGVAWDPQGQMVATLSSDRNCRLFNITNRKVIQRIHKANMPMADNSGAVTEKATRLFHDDTMQSFCRRLSFSPDGELLVTPSGILEKEEGQCTNVTYVFSRHVPGRPVLYLPTGDKFSCAVRFCPTLFELQSNEKSCENGNESTEKSAGVFNLPYRMVYAVATQNSVLLYDTQQLLPFAKISKIHYARLSDLSWSSDGRLLVVSSSDGFCSLVSFGEGELGVVYQGTQALPSTVEPAIATEAAAAKNDIEHNNIEREELTQKHDLTDEAKVTLPIAVKKVDAAGRKRVQLTTVSCPKKGDSIIQNSNKLAEDTEMKVDPDVRQKFECVIASPSKNNSRQQDFPSPLKTPSSLNKTPRRVSLITLSSPKARKRLNSHEDTSCGSRDT